MKERLWEVSGRIGFYEGAKGQFCCFSNFSNFGVEWKNIRWPTSEHAYQAAKFMDSYPSIAQEILDAKSADEAKKIAHHNHDKIPEDWDSQKIKIMEEICSNKLRQHPYIMMELLLHTGNGVIVETSPKDDFWGWGPGKDGRNELGKIWMRLRDELKNKTLDSPHT